MTGDRSPRILLVEPDAARAEAVRAGLNDAGWTDVAVLAETGGLARRMQALDPDIVLIDLADPTRDSLEALSLATGASDRPVAMFVDRSDADLARAAVEAGLSAYVVNGFDPARVRPVLETAIARFAKQRALTAERDAARAALEERKVVDRAKGALMRARGIDEPEAYALLRRAAMDRGMKLADLARAIVASADLLG